MASLIKEKNYPDSYNSRNKQEKKKINSFMNYCPKDLNFSYKKEEFSFNQEYIPRQENLNPKPDRESNNPSLIALHSVDREKKLNTDDEQMEKNNFRDLRYDKNTPLKNNMNYNKMSYSTYL